MESQRVFPRTFSFDNKASNQLDEMSKDQKYSEFMRELVNERWLQENLPGCRAAIVKLMDEYKQANGMKEPA